MTVQTLTSLASLPASVTVPSYDRSSLGPGILHIGFGAFHRAHQAVYTQRALSSSFADWGIVAVNLRSAEPVEVLNAQNGLYSVVVRGQEVDEAEIVGATIDWICAAQDPDRVLTSLANPQIKIVTLTVSEKAYGLHPGTGGLDIDHPAVSRDLANPTTPTGVLGFLVEGLARRRAQEVSPFTVLCCDNLPSNGKIVRRLVLEMARLRDPQLAEWIAQHGAFPSSMVDRIVPAASADSRARAARLLGVEDGLSIETEPFTQWVIEDRFVAGRPAWEAGGAIFTHDVEPYEKMKLRLLNGSHTLIAHLGLLHGLEHVRDVMAVPGLASEVEAHMRAAAETLDPVPGIDLGEYMRQLIARFANPAIAHRNLQIAMDSSQKLPQRIFAPAVEVLTKSGDMAPYARVVGMWLAALRRFESCNDPRQDELLAAISQMQEPDLSAPFFAMDGLFPQALVESRQWRDLVNQELKRWQ